jgi:chemotaxis protein CheC
MSARFSEMQLDAMRELGNVGSGTAATALSSMIAVPVDIDIARASALPIGDAVACAGSGSGAMTAVVLLVFGDLEALVMILMSEGTVDTVCELLGVPTDGELADSALQEVGNILGASYVRALATMIGIDLEPRPPQLVRESLGTVMATAAASAADDGVALLLQSTLTVDDHECSPSFVFIPSAGGLTDIFDRLGVSVIR